MWFWCGVSDAFVPFRFTYHVYRASIYLGFRLSVAEYGNNAEIQTNIAPNNPDCQTMYQIHAKLVYVWWRIAKWLFFFFLYFVSSKNSWGNCRCKSSLTLKSIALVVATADIVKGLFTLNVNVNFAVYIASNFNIVSLVMLTLTQRMDVEPILCVRVLLPLLPIFSKTQTQTFTLKCEWALWNG